MDTSHLGKKDGFRLSYFENKHSFLQFLLWIYQNFIINFKENINNCLIKMFHSCLAETSKMTVVAFLPESLQIKLNM